MPLLNVGEAFELAEIRGPDAISIPLRELVTRQAERDGDRPVAVIYRSGNRSAMTVQHLRQPGVDAANVAGLLLEIGDARVA